MLDQIVGLYLCNCVVSYGALESLQEAGDKLLTLHVLGITGALRKSLNNTNMIESMFAGARRRLRKVTKLSAKSYQRSCGPHLLSSLNRRDFNAYVDTKMLLDLLTLLAISNLNL